MHSHVLTAECGAMLSSAERILGNTVCSKGSGVSWVFALIIKQFLCFLVGSKVETCKSTQIHMMLAWLLGHHTKTMLIIGFFFTCRTCFVCKLPTQPHFLFDINLYVQTPSLYIYIYKLKYLIIYKFKIYICILDLHHNKM